MEIKSNQMRQQKKYPIDKISIEAVAVFLIGLLFGSGNMDEPSTFTELCLFVTTGLITLAGILIIIQKEAPRPGLPSIKGIGAVITGTLVVIAFGSGTVIMLLMFFHEFIK